MRILHLANHCHEIGNGIMNVAVDVACRQAEAGHDVAFASAGGSYVDLLTRFGIEHFDLRQDWRAPWTIPQSMLTFRRIVARQRPNIVHAHMMTGALLARFARYRSPWRLVTTVHNEWQRSAVAMGVGDRVIAVSEVVARQIALRGIASRKIEVVLNGPLNSPRRNSGGNPDVMPLDRPAILTVAGLYERKGIGDLIAAFELIAALHPTATLYIVGEGPDRRSLEEQAQACKNASRIHFLGFQADPRPYYRAADIFVLASHSEPFGLVLAEARQEGCAVIGSRVGGIPEVLQDGRRGILVPPRDPQRLAQALATLLDDPAELLKWRQAASQDLEWLDTRRVARDTLDVYRRALWDAAGSSIADQPDCSETRSEHDERSEPRS